MEDTELEKGILDSFTLKLDTTIIPLITDYLEWLLDEASDDNKNKLMEKLNDADENNNAKNVDSIYLKSDNNERLYYFENDKFDFLKLGKDDVKEFFDFENAKNILNYITMSGGNSITTVRRNFIQRRILVDNMTKPSYESENTTENTTSSESEDVKNDDNVSEEKDANDSNAENEENKENNDEMTDEIKKDEA